MEMLQVVWKQHLRPRAVEGYSDKTFFPSPPNYVSRSPGEIERTLSIQPRSQGPLFQSSAYEAKSFRVMNNFALSNILFRSESAGVKLWKAENLFSVFLVFNSGQRTESNIMTYF